MELRRSAGTQLDPSVVRIFCKEMESGRLVAGAPRSWAAAYGPLRDPAAAAAEPQP